MNIVIPENFCLAPWLHAHHNSDYLRKVCSMSPGGLDENGELLNPHSLDDYQNSPHLKSIRQQMMNGVLPKDCFACDIRGKTVTRVNSYKDSFNKRYKKFYLEALEKTLPDGTTTMPMRSFDYRFNNICNYKCRHCDWFSSSAIEHEEDMHGIEHTGLWHLDNSFDDRPDLTNFDKDLRQEHLLKEMQAAADAGVLDYIQWVGGEPLFHEVHWDFMNHLIQNCDYEDIYMSYITNLSILKFKDYDFVEMINKFNMVYVHASIESGGAAGEYIRTGMNWEKWKTNFSKIHESFRYKETREDYEHTIRAGITLTTVSLSGLREFLDFLVEQQADIASATLVKPNQNNWHLGFEYLGEYKKPWLEEFKRIIQDYKGKLLPYSWIQLELIANIIEHRVNVDLDNLNDFDLSRLKRGVTWANKTDAIRKSYMADVIKDYPFLQEWWDKLNSINTNN